jgi:hypothetical protein
LASSASNGYADGFFAHGRLLRDIKKQGKFRPRF